jgi:hypothetical protein
VCLSLLAKKEVSSGDTTICVHLDDGSIWEGKDIDVIDCGLWLPAKKLLLGG